MHEVDLFEHANFIGSARGDAFFRWLDPDQWVADTGNVEAPTGHVALVQVSAELIREYVSSAGDPWMSERRNFTPGWYLVKTNEQGTVWAFGYDGWCEWHEAFCADSFEEMKARHDFAVIEKQYAEWDSEVNHEDEKMYLVCNHCGEAFDDLAIASRHQSNDHDPDEIESQAL